jgi:hypothetical protein
MNDWKRNATFCVLHDSRFDMCLSGNMTSIECGYLRYHCSVKHPGKRIGQIDEYLTVLR